MIHAHLCETHKLSGPWINIKPFYGYGDFHNKDKTLMWPHSLENGNLYNGKTITLYLNKTTFSNILCKIYHHTEGKEKSRQPKHRQRFLAPSQTKKNKTWLMHLELRMSIWCNILYHPLQIVHHVSFNWSPPGGINIYIGEFISMGTHVFHCSCR